MKRGKKVNREVISKIIDSLDIPRIEKDKLSDLTPRKYLGLAADLCDE